MDVPSIRWKDSNLIWTDLEHNSGNRSGVWLMGTGLFGPFMGSIYGYQRKNCKKKTVQYVHFSYNESWSIYI